MLASLRASATSVPLALNAVPLGCPLDSVLDRADLVAVVLGGVVLVVDVAPGRPHVLGGVDRVPVVDRIGELNVAVLALALLRADVLAAVDLGAHWSILRSVLDSLRRP